MGWGCAPFRQSYHRVNSEGAQWVCGLEFVQSGGILIVGTHLKGIAQLGTYLQKFCQRLASSSLCSHVFAGFGGQRPIRKRWVSADTLSFLDQNSQSPKPRLQESRTNCCPKPFSPRRFRANSSALERSRKSCQQDQHRFPPKNPAPVEP